MTYTDKTIISFGIHKGKQLEQVPNAYLLWLYENDKCNKELENYILDNIDVIKQKKTNK